MAELKTYKQKVRAILAEYEPARNNDGTLWACYIFKYAKHLVVKDTEGNPAVSLSNFKNLPTSQSIRLARQLVQNEDGDYPPTDPDVKKKRGIKDENIRNLEWREAKQV